MNGKDIRTQFRAAGKLINEWRDTLSYGALGAAAAVGWIDPHDLLKALSGRELFRAASWLLNSEPVYVGARTGVNKTQLGNSVNTMSFLILAGASMLNENGGEAALYVGASTGCLIASGGPRAVWESYRDVMWDYPRKKNDGGTNQTQKLKDGIADLIKLALPAPSRPATGAARISAALPVPKVA
ncbi:MAG: hypothetical protein WBK91_08090 [Alphaproteobacteria bacterium]